MQRAESGLVLPNNPTVPIPEKKDGPIQDVPGLTVEEAEAAIKDSPVVQRAMKKALKAQRQLNDAIHYEAERLARELD